MAEHTFLGSNINQIKAHNLQAVLLTLLHEKQLSRVQLARKTGLSTTTITNLIAELIDQGIVNEEGTQSNQEIRVGRPRTNLQLVPEARYAIGVHIGIGLFRVAIVDLCAHMVASAKQNFNLRSSPTATLNQISATIRQLIKDSEINQGRIIGVGVGASGLVNYHAGVNLLAPSLGWHDVPIQNILTGSVNLPVAVDNNVRAMALGEAYFGDGQEAESLAFVYGRVGVGAGFVVNGHVFHGSSAGAGEIGHTIMRIDGGELCRCGQYGCLETLVSEPVIVSEAELIAQKNPGGLLDRVLKSEKHLSPIERVFAAARQGDPETKEMLNRRSRYLGMALANLVNMLNPQMIILGGMFAQGQDLILPLASETMRQKAFASMGDNVRLQPTSFGWSAGVIGASALALMRFFYQQQSPITFGSINQKILSFN
jgi:predicted NBD/HSP70 family sugar kinase